MIKRIGLCETGKGVFRTEHAFVETLEGKKYVYHYTQDGFGFETLEEYLDQAKYDFEGWVEDMETDMFEEFDEEYYKEIR